jgi:hypothetical protein
MRSLANPLMTRFVPTSGLDADDRHVSVELWKGSGALELRRTNVMTIRDGGADYAETLAILEDSFEIINTFLRKTNCRSGIPRDDFIDDAAPCGVWLNDDA